MKNGHEKWTALIVDDEPLARKRLETLLAEDEDICLVGSTGDPREALQTVAEREPDLLLIDVQMPEISGMDVVRQIPETSMPLVIFVTAFEEYAVSAFDLHAIDYVLKPVDRDRFRTSLDRAKRQLRLVEDGPARSARTRQMLESFPATAPLLDRIIVQINGRMRLVRLDQVEWIEAAGNYVKVHVGGGSYLFREGIGAIEEKLDPRRFVRIHRSTVVNVDFVKELAPRAFGDYLVYLRDGTQLVLSRRYRDQLAPMLGKL